jgi:glycosyltransferase involved in cell wall biosynthesis
MQNTCCVFNYPPHYRSAIYRLMDNCHLYDFYFGDKLLFDLKPMDYHILTGYKGTLKNIKIGSRLYYQKGILKLLFKNYKTYLLTGELYAISTWLFLLFSKLSGKDTYLWTHGYYGNESNAKRFLKRLFFNLSHGVFLYGERAKNIMLSEGFDSARLHVIYNSLDYENLHAIRKRIKLTQLYRDHFKNECPNIIFIGRLQKVKKVNYLIEAIKILKKRGKLVNLTIVGEGEEIEGIWQSIKDFAIEDQVWIFGPCYDDLKTGELLYNSDLLVSPGNVGLSAVHGLTFGTPIITHNNLSLQMPEFEAIKPGITGDFFVEDSITDLADKIYSWVNIDSAKRDQIRQVAYNTIQENYNPDVQLRILNSVLNQG